MATAAAYSKAMSSGVSDGQNISVQAPDNSWALDLNTLVTIVFGVISIAFQAGHMYYARAKQRRIDGPVLDDIENDGGRPLARREEAQFTLWHPQHNWNELDEYRATDTPRAQPGPTMSTRGGAPRKVLRRDEDGQAGGTGHMPPGYVYRRSPWQNNDWGRDPSPRLIPTGAALERHYAPRQQPGLV
ncbi:hypothetical protein KVR01_010278 [Diaporthe batatas]|uniref:uncharacterized protein n=1 Tax=Diaporthe batatas TaxID=748121 RepID=UPI001D03B6EA|nr:uncharacterized protein KVR01_010278 [Diaporthe batatas]KAG8159641.1 hypothetical protein KVR01_010278 [Diaporthe batatas]